MMKMVKTDKEKVDKKESILDAAEKLFSEMGYDGTSTRMIAAKARVNMAMLNYYFGSKDGLYKSVLERCLEIFDQDSSILNDQDSSWDKLYKCLDFYTEQVLSDNYFQRLIHRELSLQQRSDMTDFITESIVRTTNEIKQIISEGIESGAFRNVDVELTVASIFGTKYYLINSTHIASKILNKDLQNPQIMKNEIKPRVKKHLHDLLNAHLKKHRTED
jgi:AcrR family transcriptional regulator